MSRLRKLVHEVHRRSLWQVLGIYVAASWVVLQVVGQLQESLDLPGWLSGAAVVLLIVGLPIVLASAIVGTQAATRPEGRGSPSGGRPDTPSEADGTLAGDATAAGPEGEPRHRLPSPRNAILAGATAFLLLLGIAGAYVLIRDRTRTSGSDDEVAIEAAPGIVVLPFNVSGPDVEFWREGMAQALALSLDGLAGLRTIDSRTVLTRWEDRLGDRSSLDLQESLEVARAAGGRYALLGDLVSSGTRLQAAVAAYDVEAGERLDRVQVEGSAAEDSSFALLNRLTLQTLRMLPQATEEDLRQIDLARLTTDSIAALRAFLEGELQFRHEDYGPAIEAFARAVSIDPTFALAHYRLSLAYGWRDYAAGTGGHNRKAVEYSDRLPERTRLLARAHLDYTEGRAYDARDALEEVTRKYPDEVEAWYLLGETLFHLGDQMLGDPAESRGAFERVAELDPSFRPGQRHRVDVAFMRGDSAAVRELLGLGGDGKPLIWEGEPLLPAFRIARRLAFGTAAERDSALATLDRLPADSLISIATLLGRPAQLAIQDSVLGRLADPAGAFSILGSNYLNRGKLAAFRSLLEGAASPAAVMTAFVADAAGYDIPAPLMEVALERGRRLGPGPWLGLMSAYLIDHGREEEVGPLESAREPVLDSLRSIGSGLAHLVEGSELSVRAYGIWRRSGPGAAVDSLIAAQRAVTGWARVADVNAVTRWWTATALLETGREDEAEAYYLSVFRQPDGAPLKAVAAERLASLYDDRGDLERAARYYAVFTEMWKDADPELQPRVEAARTRLQEILAERG